MAGIDLFAFDFLSGLVSSEVSVTSATTLTISRQHVCTGTSADYTCPLPSVSGNSGKFLSVRMSPLLTKLVTLDAGAGVSIDGQSTTLSAAITTAVATSISITSATGFPTKAPYFIQIGSEQMLVTAGFGTTTWTVTRGVNGTTATTHLISTPVDYGRTRMMWAGESATLYCDGSNWFKQPGGKTIPMVGCIRRNTTQTGITNALVANPVNVDTPVIDNTNMMVEEANNRIRIKRPNNYIVQGCVNLDLNATGSSNRCISVCQRNGANAFVFEASNAAASTTPSLPLYGTGPLNAEDLLTLQVFQNSSGNQQVFGSTTVFRTFLSATEVPSW